MAGRSTEDYAPPAERDKLFEKLRTKPGNKNCFDCGSSNPTWGDTAFGVFVCLDCSGEHRRQGTGVSFMQSCTMDEWNRGHLRAMKVGGNEAATKFFQSHGGTAALKNKDFTTKYTSSAATKYKAEVQKRVEGDRRLHPDRAFVSDDTEATDGTSTPSGDPSDDFFSSWDKPAVKKLTPTPPISRTGTPGGISRTASPFLKPGDPTDGARAPSPLSASTDNRPAASKITHSSALKKTTVGAKKTNILGAKKPASKLGVKKATGVTIDFDEAEKKAKEEAERIEKLGYNPDEEAAEAKKSSTSTAASSSIIAPTPVAPSSGGYGSSASHTREKSAAEMERLGMGMGRLGFGQIGAAKTAAPAKKAGGFGSIGSSKPAEPEETFARSKFGAQKGISSDEFFGKGHFDPNQQAEAKTRLQGFQGATSISSNAYFGRPEEDAPAEEYGDLESAAVDFVRKFGITAADDLENVTQLVGSGANALRGAIRSYLGN